MSGWKKSTNQTPAPHKGDVFIARLPAKTRPVVIVGTSWDHVTYMECTRQYHGYNSPYRIRDFTEAGVDDGCFVSRGSVKSMETEKLLHRIGRISRRDREEMGFSFAGSAGVTNGPYGETWQNMVINRYQ